MIIVTLLFALYRHVHLLSSIILDAGCAKVVVGTESAGRSVEACGISPTHASVCFEVTLTNPGITLDMESSHQMTNRAHTRGKRISCSNAIIPSSESVLGTMLSQLFNPLLFILLGAFTTTALAHPKRRGDVKRPNTYSEWSPATNKKNNWDAYSSKGG